MKATLNIVTNPFHPMKGRIQKPLARRAKINTLVRKHKIDLSKPVVCYYNGSPILRKQWAVTVVKDSDIVTFVYLPQGRGGGSMILKIVLMLAVAVFAPYAAGILGPMMGMAATAVGAAMSPGMMALTAGIGLAGTMLVNALIPPPKPPKAQIQQQVMAPSPTYTIGAQGNQARLGQPLPVLYGTMRVYPDFAAQPYAEYENNEQYLYQLFCITQGECTVDTASINVEDSPISSFSSDYQYEVLGPNQNPTLYPRDVYNVAEVTGQDLLTGTQIGPFAANPTTSSVNKLAFDIVAPSGLNYVNDSGTLSTKTATVECRAQLIDDAGTPLAPAFLLGTETLTGATSTAIRKTYKYDVSPGRYSVSVTRTDTKDMDSRASHSIVWASARGYSSQQSDYGNTTLIAVKTKATAISSQSSRKISLVATRKLAIPTYNAITDTYDWSVPTATNSIAWAIADMCRSSYGAAVTDARFDIAQLTALDSVWTSRGDELNGVFDSAQTFWEALVIACRVGRARPYIQGGVVHFVRDALQTLPTAMFTSRNITKGSFKISYVMPSEDNADCIDVEYFDETIWKPRVIRAALDPETTVKPAKVRSFGITSRNQAYKEGMYSAAANRYRRKEVSFETELEGHIPSLGDLVGIQSDIPEWGQHGEVISSSIDGTNTIVESSEPLEWTEAAIHYVMLRRANGSACGPLEVTQGATTSHFVVATSLLDFDLYAGHEKEKTYIAFGRSGSVIQLARVLSLTPRSNYRVQVSAINEDARVHSADGTSVPADVYEWSLTTPKIKPTLLDFNIAQVGNGTTPSISLSWQAPSGASRYIIEKSTDNENWETVGEVTTTSFSFISNVGLLYVRVGAFGGILGPYVTKSITVGEVAPPANVLSGSIGANGQAFEVSWAAVTDCEGYYVEVLESASVKRSFNTTATNFSYTVENAIADGGPWRSISVKIKARKGSVLSATALTLNGTNAAPAAPTLTLVAAINATSVTVSKSDELDRAGTVIHGSTVSGFTPATENKLWEGDGDFYMHNGISETWYYKAAHYDTYGKTGLNYSVEATSTPNENVAGITTVTSLPASPAEVDGVFTIFLDVVDTATRGLYTWDGSAWIYNKALTSGSVTASHLSPGIIFSAEIEAGEVEETHIANDSITTPKIRAGAVTTSKLVVGNFANLCENNDFELGDLSWTKGVSWTIVNDPTNAYNGSWVAARAGNAVGSALRNVKFKCVPNQKYIAQAHIKLGATANGHGYVRVTTYDAAGAETVVGNGNFITSTTYTMSEVTITVPSDAVNIRVEVVATNTVGDIYCDQGVLSINSLTVIEPGSITTEKLAAGSVVASTIASGVITGEHITGTTLSAIKANLGDVTGGSFTLDASGYIKAGATGYNTGTGIWMGYSGGVYKMSIGGATQGFTWDGTAFTIKGGSINMNNLFTVSATGAVSIKNAASGARLEISNDVIKVYDASSVLRVQLGNLDL